MNYYYYDYGRHSMPVLPTMKLPVCQHDRWWAREGLGGEFFVPAGIRKEVVKSLNYITSLDGENWVPWQPTST